MPIDPQLRQLLDNLPLVHVSDVPIAEARRIYEERTLAIPVMTELPHVEDRTVPGPDGAPDVPVRIYQPVENPRDLPVVVYYHGGGWALGSPATHDPITRIIAARTGAVVVSVNYRLGPEHPFPAAVHDSFAALRWVGEHAAELGGDPARIAVAGDSAGGNLAAVMALLARDAGGPALVYQLLWYPATALDADLPSITENADAPVLNAADIDVFLRHYTGDGLDRENPPVTLAPATAADHSGLPPAFIGTAQYDPIRDDGVRYAEKLRAAGVDVQLRNYEDLVHGYAAFAPFVPTAGKAVEESLAALSEAL